MELFGNQNVKLYLSITFPILVVLIIILYRNLFSTVNNNVISASTPTVSLVNMPSCGSLKASEQYHISDYYIAASYMTPCLQGSYYGYVSSDMIRKVIQGGARMIQIPICQESASSSSLAVCAICEPDTMLITSLNSLELDDVWRNVMSCAFQDPSTNNRITNPLFIELVINTKNVFTLDHLADTITARFSPLKIIDKKVRLVLPSDYDDGKFIFLEKLCRLQNKIVMFTTSPISNSDKLSALVFHIRDGSNKSLFRKIANTALSSTIVPTGLGGDYNRMLSRKHQQKTTDVFQQKYIPQLEELMVSNPSATPKLAASDIEDIGYEILNDDAVADKNIAFNKIGITCIEPAELGTNYDFSQAVASGCQIIYMNWQTVDSNLQSYMKMFAASSFVLKPDGMRLRLDPSISRDIAALYPAVEKLPIPLIGNFGQFQYNLVMLAYHNNPNMVLTNVNGNLVMANKLVPTNINQTFVPIPSGLPSNGGSIHFAMPNDFNRVITVNNTGIMIGQVGLERKALEGQSWYPIEPLVPDSEFTGGPLLLSIQIYNKLAKRCLIYQNNNLVLANADTGNKDILGRMVLEMQIVPSIVLANFISQTDDIIKITSVGAVGVINKNSGSNTDFIVESAIPRQPLKEFYNIPIRLKIRSMDKYLSNDSTGVPIVKDNIKSADNIYTLATDITGNNMVRILDKNGKPLTIVGKNGLQFIKPSKDTSNIKTTFKLDTKFVISNS